MTNSATDQALRSGTLRFFFNSGTTLLFITLLFPLAQAEDLAAGLGISMPSLNLKLKNTSEGTGDNRLEYSPNNRNNTVVAFSYGHLGASLSFRQSSLSEDKKDIPLDTQFEDYQFRFFGRRHSYSLFYQRYKGYHLNNFSDFDNTITEADPLVNNSKLKTEHYGLGYVYNLSPQTYSLDSAFGISSSQEKSGGSWLLSGALEEYFITSPTPLAPSFAVTSLPHLMELKGVRLTSLSVGAGGGYTYVINNFYLSGLLMFALTGQKQRHTFVNKTETEMNSTNKLNAGVSFGYNSKKFKISLQSLAETTRTDIGKASIEATMIEAQILFIYRLGEVTIPGLNKVSQLFD